jgi:sortase A
MLTQKQLHWLNNIISWVVIALAFYILFTPFLPDAEYHISKTVRAASPSVEKKAELPPKENRLIIPEIGVNAPILESESPDVLDKGIWRRPNTSTPDMGGNTVLVGHRFMYTSGQTTFYLLPKMKVGDTITVYWNKAKYSYIVKNMEVVPPTAIEVEAPTTEPMLTLYTCTPLWNPTQRFVIKATPQV